MTGQLKIVLVTPYIDEKQMSSLKASVEQFVQMNPQFKMERVEYTEYAKRPTDEIMTETLLDIAKKLDELKTQQSMSE